MIPMSDPEFRRIAEQVAQYAQWGGPPLTRQDAALLLAEAARARWNEVHLIATVRRLSGVFRPDEAGVPRNGLRGLPGGREE